MITRRLVMVAGGVVLLLVVAAVVWWICHPKPDPRVLVLGDWREPNSQLYVEVTPDQATARGAMQGVVRYEWVDTEHEPYRLRFTYHGDSYEALVSFVNKDTAVVEPLIWHIIPADKRQALRDYNRRHKRPEDEFRLVFKRRAAR